MPESSASPAQAPKWNPADYHQHSSQQQKWARELIAKLAPRPGDEILDLGCGDGKVTAELAAAVPAGRVVGIDASEDMIRFARAEFPPAAHPNLRFEVMDARQLRLADEFDLVFSNATLHWIVDHRPVLAGIVRALRPGGRALLQMGGKGCAAAMIEIVEEVVRRPAWRPFFADFGFPYGFYSPEEYLPWLREAGLEPIRVELIPKDMVHHGTEGLAGWFRTTWMPYTSRIPEEDRARFIDEAVQGYVAKFPPDAAGDVHIHMPRLEVEARR